jgi:hypothetical protein
MVIWPPPPGPGSCPADVWRGSRIGAVWGRVVMLFLSYNLPVERPKRRRAGDSQSGIVVE